MKIVNSELNSIEKAVEREYLITNGLGGFSSASVTGMNTRKYHAILNASLVSPVKRQVLVSKLDEALVVEGKEINLSTNEFLNKKEEGYKYLLNFENLIVPTFEYKVGSVKIKKRIAMEYKKNTTAVVYEIETGEEDVKFKVTPFVNNRDHHEVSAKHDFEYSQEINENILKLTSENMKLKLSSNMNYKKEENWSEPMFYHIESRRKQTCIDYHFIPGIFELKIPKNTKKTIKFVATIESEMKDAKQIIEEEIKRRKELIEKAEAKNELEKELVIAADAFIVDRESTKGSTIIAGYPWFTDWGRDTMIAFTGLTLTTKRFEEAKSILNTFVRYIDHGLIPNMFPDSNVEPMYNTVDGTLWFFHAVEKYLEYTGDKKFVEEIYEKLENIIDKHIKGTINNIYMDEDKLITAGGEGTQLTWMDVKVNGWVVTPRHGKAVEINALWYNALKVMENFAKKLNKDPLKYEKLSSEVKKNFVDKFWNEQEQCLYDCIQEKKIDKIRPNQIMAVSLPYIMLDDEKAKSVLKKVYKEHYTAYGLRSLSKNDEEYQGEYSGSVLKRDGAYHQGTVWAWLFGPFIDAYYRVYKEEGLKEIKEMTNLYLDHMRDGCIGSISEILEGNEPHLQRGCPAQAWSVAEVLRVSKEILK